MNTAPNIVFLNGNDPVDVGVILISAMLEYFTHHMGEKALENFSNFMPALCDAYLSPEGLALLDQAREKREKMIQ